MTISLLPPIKTLKGVEVPYRVCDFSNKELLEREESVAEERDQLSDAVVNLMIEQDECEKEIKGDHALGATDEVDELLRLLSSILERILQLEKSLEAKNKILNDIRLEIANRGL